MKIRLKDIAKMAGVSETTVSLVLNDSPSRISERKKEEIKKIASDLHYVPNSFARGLATRKSQMIGLIVPDIENPFFSGYAKAVEDELRKKGYLTIITNTNDNYSNEQELITLLINRGIDGFLLIMSNETYSHLHEFQTELEKLSIPYILADRIIENKREKQVYYDHITGEYLATKYLIENGHEHIGFLMGNQLSAASRQRLQGYKKALGEYHIPFRQHYCVESNFKFSGGYSDSVPLLLNNKLTAIIAINDMMAYGVIKKAKEIGIHVPDDLSVIGYDNLDLSTMLDISLTTIEQNIQKLGKESVKLLLKVINGESGIDNMVLKPTLIKKGSVKKIN